MDSLKKGKRGDLLAGPYGVFKLVDSEVDPETMAITVVIRSVERRGSIGIVIPPDPAPHPGTRLLESIEGLV